MRRLIFALGLILLITGAFFVWRLIRYYSIPETPRTTVIIFEGWTVDDVNRQLRDVGVLTDGELGDELEGYLFPDTYEFFLDSTVEVVQKRFLDNFEEQVRKIGLDVNHKDLKETIIMASLLEKEVRDLKEKRIASGILWKRLENEMPLQVDATICYLKLPKDCLPITGSDKKIDSKYNTYLYRGLPPGPIGNPGADSILAATRPATSPYWYYLSNQVTGETVFAKTLDEHNRNIVKYLNE
ncbi:MAG: endolytic transglycosylase MltG [Candidatus Colwellbacteria bacterium CG10_big_fil_rev_8_21_14_0_10_42_22]|uniref:Endolytic transglycosylase MltG n=1 Tax=Candidatus Colwellbacteria bacterium CG10_big_fil_rev_8_21_14_0_10_42_22 TaxID=1974540 RepID=A0A2H0VG24_9BACT|nr:MAG: endolytic transglycosylase MltG [Candidatus Colwellbacteria bacterium CG10_big_fil_rev_8_21_14_0_10_42_22]